MVVKEYIPQRGDVVWVSFSPTKGHEQDGRRPGLVLSPKLFNQKTSLAIVVPISSQSHGYNTEVGFKLKNIEGFVLASHIKTVDWRARKVEYTDRVNQDTLARVQSIVISLIISS